MHKHARARPDATTGERTHSTHTLFTACMPSPGWWQTTRGPAHATEHPTVVRPHALLQSTKQAPKRAAYTCCSGASEAERALTAPARTHTHINTHAHTNTHRFKARDGRHHLALHFQQAAQVVVGHGEAVSLHGAVAAGGDAHGCSRHAAVAVSSRSSACF